jgi:hypothetical protein
MENKVSSLIDYIKFCIVFGTIFLLSFLAMGGIVILLFHIFTKLIQ